VVGPYTNFVNHTICLNLDAATGYWNERPPGTEHACWPSTPGHLQLGCQYISQHQMLPSVLNALGHALLQNANYTAPDLFSYSTQSPPSLSSPYLGTLRLPRVTRSLKPKSRPRQSWRRQTF